MMRYKKLLARFHGAIENNTDLVIEASQVDSARQCLGIPKAGETTFNHALNVADNSDATPQMLRNAIREQAALSRHFCDLAEEAQAHNNCTVMVLSVEGEKLRFIGTNEAALAKMDSNIAVELYRLGVGPTPSELCDQAYKSGAMDIRAAILARIDAECERQHNKWGEQNHPDGTADLWTEQANRARAAYDKADKAGKLTWLFILREEMFEAFAETDPAALAIELEQVAAVAVSWIAAIERRNK